ncbi:hypothetical protein B296_00035214 [Ensete ventricosum]|uniref:Uncharacterized protein n=1 Tax=Ensete ventricosum TaxID=4639 RepID=A0A426Z6V7_ENSVE|nr:hypothetical protein B296_00035214 [Ensete ventricosum]
MVSRAGWMSSTSSHSESQLVKLSTPRPKVLSRPSGDSMSVAVVPSTSALDDSRTADALAVMRSFFNVDSTVTTRRLVEVRKNYFIPPKYELHDPLIKILIASCDRGVPRAVEDFSFPDGAQLVTVSSGFSVRVSCVGYKGYPRVVYGLLPAKSRASRVLLGRL